MSFLGSPVVIGYPELIDVFTFTSSAGDWTAPAGTRYIWAKVWGAGGGGRGGGGAGGFSKMLIDINALPNKRALNISVGSKGSSGAGAPNGGSRGASGSEPGGGGGRSTVRGSGGTVILIAGAGGGGGDSATVGVGGSAGYPTGANATGNVDVGKGGTQSAGGSINPLETYPGNPGGYLFGGNANGSGVHGAFLGGGGDGYYGGSGPGTSGGGNSGGGGGSSYYNTAVGLYGFAAPNNGATSTPHSNVISDADYPGSNVSYGSPVGGSLPYEGGNGFIKLYCYSKLLAEIDLP
jgi:hypothetical protein